MANLKSTPIAPIIFKRNLRVGSPDAENDTDFLDNCFYDTGDLDVLKDCSDPRRVIIGRTGSGKTALIKKIALTEENVIELPPEVLSISHISNSNIIAFFDEIGFKKLEEFYVLLWKHVITVELLRKKYNIYNQSGQRNFKDRIQALIPDKSKKKALDYIESWGDKFWEETQYRIREITTNIETELKASLKTAQFVELNVDGARKLSEDQKKEIKAQAFNAIDKIQIRELHNIVTWLADDVFTDEKQAFYILIDRLDEDWVDENIKYRLIKALLDTVRSFVKVKPVKIILTLRDDLLARVIERSTNSGFQYEKYESQFLFLRWNEKQLEELLNKRVQYLFANKYVKSIDIELKDIISDKEIDQVTPVKYIIERTFHRPREVISFFNECIFESEGNSKITKSYVKKAEYNYSSKRLRELESEWKLNYPCIKEYLGVLKKKKREFLFGDLQRSDFDDLTIALASRESIYTDPIEDLAKACLLENGIASKKCEDLPYELFKIFYRVGIIGIKQEQFEKFRWSFIDSQSITDSEIYGTTLIRIHPAYWLALGIIPKSAKNT